MGKTEVTEAQKDSKALLETMAGMHSEMGQEHSDMAAYHGDAFEACEKGTDAVDLNKVVPLPAGFSVVAPTPPIRTVFRTGQKEFSAPLVDPAFAHLVKIEDGLDE
jgi:hypothetical protein